DLDCVRAADYIVELGPLAGANGGEIVAACPSERWDGSSIVPQSPVPRSAGRRGSSQKRDKASPSLQIRGANVRNLRNLDLDIPLGRFVSLTGVSGSGKSTLVSEVILRAYNDFQKNLRSAKGVKGFEHFKNVLLVDQSPLAKSPRANVATYTK